MNRNIILCGFMGSGKTVTGKTLAQKLNMEFIDLDQYIESEQKMSVNDIFEKFGETYFRNLESEASQKLGSANKKIIACGGGTVMNPLNVNYLKANGDIFYLSVSAETVKSRLKSDTTRPLLAKDKANAIDSLLAAREPVYKAVADHIIDSNGSIDSAVEQILKLINN